MRRHKTDVFIVGGGPAGLAAAIAACRRGLRVIVSDGSAPPVDKACGEGLMPDSREAAARLGIEIPNDLGFEFRGIRFHGCGRSVEAGFPHGSAIGVRRTALHAAMIDAALRAGAELHWKSPVSDFAAIDARWIIGADGVASRVRAWSGLDRFRDIQRRFAYRMHFAVRPWTDFMEIYWAAERQLCITPVAEHEVCVAMMARTSDLRIPGCLDRFFPAVAARLASRVASSRERGAITANARLQHVARSNVALIGDASGTVDAITGEGLCLSFKQAEALAEAMARGDLGAYNRCHPQLVRRARVMARAMLLLDRGFVMRQIAMSALSWQPRIFAALLAVHVA